MPADVPVRPAPFDIGLVVLDLLRQGLTPEEMIAQGRVRMTLLDLTRMCRALKPDSRTQAKQLIDAEALRLASDIIDYGKSADKVKLLAGRGVLDDDQQKGGLTIIVGGDARVQVNVGTSAPDVTFAPASESAQAKVLTIPNETLKGR